MPKVDVELGPLEVRWGENSEMFREFTAQVARAGSYAGELIGSTRMIKVVFTEESGVTDVEVERMRRRDEAWDVDYLPQLSDDRKARRIVSSAVKTSIRRLEPQTIEDMPPWGLGMEK